MLDAALAGLGSFCRIHAGRQVARKRNTLFAAMPAKARELMIPSIPGLPDA